ncbi:unnamed protein product [Effrenium voratum]|uniref:Ion transport domain-containing protein n=1 Tax=Effrenium voratum TaxID=2562239 RepID=A0AA36N625_9DINO|nr:unnamed protein product [Effrenium voratum]
MTPQLELRKMNRTCAFDEEGARSPGQVMVPDAAGRGTRLMTARPDPRFQPSRAPQHWRLTQQNSELEGREARAAMMKMYVTGSFAYVAPTARERALKLVVSWPWVLLQLFALALDAATLVSHVASAGLEALWASTEPSMIHALRIGFLSLVYLADVLLRVYGFGAKVFFAKWPNVLDALIVAFTALHAVATVTESAGVTSPLRYLRLLRAFRVLRIIRIALFMSHTLPRCCSRLAARHRREQAALRVAGARLRPGLGVHYAEADQHERASSRLFDAALPQPAVRSGPLL